MFRDSNIVMFAYLLAALLCSIDSTAIAKTCAEEYRELSVKTAESRLPSALGATAKAIESTEHGESYYIDARENRTIATPGKDVVEGRWFYKEPPTGRDGNIVSSTNARIKGWEDLRTFRRLQPSPAEFLALKRLREKERLTTAEHRLFKSLEAKEREFLEARKKMDVKALSTSLQTERELEEGRTLVGPLLVAHTHSMLQRAVEAQKDGKTVRILFPLPEGVATWQIAIRLLEKGKALGKDNPYAGLSANKNLYLFPSVEKIAELRNQIKKEKESPRPHAPTIKSLTDELISLHEQTKKMFTDGSGGREKITFGTDKFLVAAVGFGADKPVGDKGSQTVNPTEVIGQLFQHPRSPFYAGNRYLGFDLAIYAGKAEKPAGVKAYLDSTTENGYAADIDPIGTTTTSRAKLNQAILGNKNLSEFIVNRIGEDNGALFMENSGGKPINGNTVNEAFTLKPGEKLEYGQNNLPFAHGVLDAAGSADVKKLNNLNENQHKEVQQRFFDFLDLNHVSRPST